MHGLLDFVHDFLAMREQVQPALALARLERALELEQLDLDATQRRLDTERQLGHLAAVQLI